MAAAQLSPTANLLRKSRLFALPHGVSYQGSLSRTGHGSPTATLPHPTRAAIVTPASSLAKGDWGLKRALPAKSTTQKNSRPVVRINALDTFEHVTDFDSAADHTVTLEKFQDLHLPISLPSRITYASNIRPKHDSPFEEHVDNTEMSDIRNEAEAKRFRLNGPWLAGMTETEFDAYLKKVQKDKPELLRKIRKDFIAKRKAERRKEAIDSGKHLSQLPRTRVTHDDFQNYLKTLRGSPYLLGPVIFKLLNIASFPVPPNDRIGRGEYFPGNITNLSAKEYSFSGPPKTHPSAGLSYMRSHASVHNHPQYGPQAWQRPVEARILRSKSRRGKPARFIVGIAGIAVDESSVAAYSSDLTPPGMSQFDSTIPGGAKYHVSPHRASIAADGRINLLHQRASISARTAYGVQDYEKPKPATTPNMQARLRTVARLDQPRPFARPQPLPEELGQNTEAVARNLLRTLNSQE
ncbi:mitochondrial ribosomal protein MRP51 [Aspergillus karnatakaensis]|uniref:mitochondrial 37S ribosomal protein bS1m n=1 Tax=Aspergillus karnatakaensis TaxID=1810916 RepID=UPI003CCD37B3